MSRWRMADWAAGACGEPLIASESGQVEVRVARAAVALLRGDVAVLQTLQRTVMASVDGVESGESARDLANPLDALKSGYCSQLSVPLWQNGHRIGALAVLGREERRFSDADVALLQALAGQLDADLRSVH
ncbi:GAF domain-containing protein [Sphingomonas azotifigens]|uniref:GAF domain-containing protein n=1 Tax=Sphingomonas azotifigens TaxID=330920 RepID=UPI001FE4D3F6|nr:GAF domain-containing protein [Sphingomonas azotifigens]